MTIDRQEQDNTITLALSGRLDTITAPELQEALLPEFDQAGQKVVLNFSKLEYVSSAGLRVLLTGQKAAQKNQGELTLVAVSEDIMEVFKMTGFTKVLNIQ